MNPVGGAGRFLKLGSKALLPVVVALLATGSAHGSDCAPPACTLLVRAQATDNEAATARERAPRTESVTLLVRGMMKSRSGAT